MKFLPNLSNLIIFIGLSTTWAATIFRRSRSSISIGSCTWVIDRKCPDIDVKFYLYTRDNLRDRQYVYIDETLEKSNLTSSFFNPMHPTKIIIHGYNSDMFLNPLIAMKEEYLQRDNYNLFYVDWSNLSPGPCYFSAVHNARHTGACIGQLIERILETGTANIHLIGFSLGAQVTNFVAQSVGSFVIPRISGLDPAMPLFITASKDNKLDASDADFVDVIHTNALVQGKIERCGHVDFYMNGGIIQPGCMNGGENPFACSHHRAPDYFAESIRSYKGFWGWQCSSYINYLLGLCPKTNFLVLAGEDCNLNSNGMFLITTNDHAPFATGKWTDSDVNTKNLNGPDISAPFHRFNPLMQNVDQWGKLESSFNNIEMFPTPFPQDPNAPNWPYFSYDGTNDITQTLKENSVDVTAPPTSLLIDTIKLLKSGNPFPSTTAKTKTKSNQKRHEIQNDTQRRQQFLHSYKANLTSGIMSTDIFRIPTFQEH